MRISLLVWLVVGLLVALLAQVTLEYFWILAFVPLVAWAVSGLVILLAILWRARRHEDRRHFVLPALGVISGWLRSESSRESLSDVV